MTAIRVNHWYSKQEVDQMVLSPELTAKMIKGYVLQHEPENNRFRFVHTTSSRMRTDDGRVPEPKLFDSGEAFAGIRPIVKRKPLERVDSLMLKMIADCQKAGTVPGLNDAKISEIVGEAWRSGKSHITTEVVRTIAGRLLAEAEAKRLERESHFSTTPSNT